MLKNRNNIKDIAYSYVFKSPDKQLQVWWSTTYKRPLFHDSLSDYTEEELLIEYFVNKFIEDDKFLSEYEKDAGIISEDKRNDEDWLKKQMGSEYVGEVKKDEEIHDVY